MKNVWYYDEEYRPRVEMERTEECFTIWQDK